MWWGDVMHQCSVQQGMLMLNGGDDAGHSFGYAATALVHTVEACVQRALLLTVYV